MRKPFLFLFALLSLVGCAANAEIESNNPAPEAPPKQDPKDTKGTTTTEVSCTEAEATLLGPVSSVSKRAVTVLSDDGKVMTLLIDATAGGPQAASTEPRIYVNLETGARVDVSDTAAKTSIEWDLALKRATLFTNGGSGGKGDGGAVKIAKDFSAVTKADAQKATLIKESFFDAQCEAKLDANNTVQTSFDGWYDYEESSHVLTPAAGTWIVRGAAGAFFKVRIVTYYADSEGKPGGGASARFVIETQTL